MLLSKQDKKHMIGHDDNDEEVHYKVADKRKFNSDGSLREGVTLDAEPVRTPAPAAEPTAQPQTVAEETFTDPMDEEAETSPGADGEDIPGADDPASFVNFLSTLATNAAASLGAVPHPATGKRSLDLDTGKYWLDVLAMIRDKTKGNLHPKEDRLLEGLLADLRLQYVQLVRATEEKLKAQAAQQFSSADILGKK
ncbi:MAG TPA: DUF1844 domain-containing protein [Pyrinomonadaceae bacterium]|nr:DUF1844 domain-containing protein [Pyrinomonadaceae bacterium]